MTKDQGEPTVLRNPNRLAFEQHYVNHSITLYTGADISWGVDARYGLGGRNDFARRILVTHENPNSAALAKSNQRVGREWAGEPREMAERVGERYGRKACKRRVTAIIQWEGNLAKE